jgi:hypothetical protein
MTAPADPLRAARLERRVLAAIVLAALGLMLIAFHWGLPNLHSWNGDDVAPDKPLRVVNDWFRGHHKYPYMHWWLNLPLYLPWLATVALRGEVDLGCFPRLRSSCFTHPWRDMTVFIAISRALSVAMGVGIVLATRRLALAVHGDRGAALLAAAIAAGSPVLVFFAHTSNLDVPVVFWFTWSLVAAERVWHRGARIDYALFAVLAGFAITTKDPILGAYPLLGAALLAVHARRVARETGLRGAPLARRALLDRRLLALVGILVGIYVLVQNVIFNFSGFVEHWRFWIEGSPVYNALRTRTPNLARFLFQFWRSLEGLLGAPVLVLCTAGAVWTTIAVPRSRWLLLPVVSYFVVSLRPSFVEPRLVLPLLPIIAVWGGLVGARLLRIGLPAVRVAVAAALALALAYEYTGALHLGVRMLYDSRYEAEAWMAQHVPKDARITALAAPAFLPRVERMGYDVRWVALSDIHRGLVEEDGAPWLILTDGGHPWSDRSYLDGIRAGRFGYEVAYLARGPVPFLRWLDSRRAPGAVSPPIFVLRKREPDAARGEAWTEERGAQRPGTENR